MGIPLAGQETGRAPAASESPMDEEEILPLLEDIVEPGDPILAGLWDEAGPGTGSTVSSATRRALPGTDFERDILAFKLRTHFSAGLEQIVPSLLDDQYSKTSPGAPAEKSS